MNTKLKEHRLPIQHKDPGTINRVLSSINFFGVGSGIILLK